MNKRAIRERIEWFFDLVTPTRIVKAEVTYLAPNSRLQGKKIIITGGNRGLGFSMARKFTQEGAQVLIAGRDVVSLKQSANEIGCDFLSLDVNDVSSFSSFMEKSDKLLGGVNVLVNNAGVSLHEGDISNVTENSFNIQLNTNLRGGYFLSKEFLKVYERDKRQKGSILFMSSERGRYVDDIPYGLTKAAINSLVEGLSIARREANIRINALAPGITATKMTGHNIDNLNAPTYSTGRVYLPEEVAEIACFLISDAAGCVSGQTIYCDNGYSVNSYKK